MTERTELKPNINTEFVLNGIISGLMALPEMQRMEVMQAVLNLMLHGAFCDNKEPLSPIPSSEVQGQFDLLKQSDAEKVLQLRSTM